MLWGLHIPPHRDGDRERVAGVVVKVVMAAEVAKQLVNHLGEILEAIPRKTASQRGAIEQDDEAERH